MQVGLILEIMQTCLSERLSVHACQNTHLVLKQIRYRMHSWDVGVLVEGKETLSEHHLHYDGALVFVHLLSTLSGFFIVHVLKHGLIS